MKTLDQQRRTLRRATVALVVGALAALALPAVSLAGGPGPFTDVPIDHTFVNEISEVANAGVARGYDDGSYRPGNPVTRQAMAAFLSRAGSSSFMIDAAVQDPDIDSVSITQTLRTQAVSIPGTNDTTQYVQAQGYVLLDAAGTGCPCEVMVQIINTTTGETSPQYIHEVAVGPGSDVDDTLTAGWLFEVDGGIDTFQLRARLVQTSGGGSPSLTAEEAVLITTVIPFSAQPLL
jgi:hypothetical protein